MGSDRRMLLPPHPLYVFWSLYPFRIHTGSRSRCYEHKTKNNTTTYTETHRQHHRHSLPYMETLRMTTWHTRTSTHRHTKSERRTQTDMHIWWLFLSRRNNNKGTMCDDRLGTNDDSQSEREVESRDTTWNWHCSSPSVTTTWDERGMGEKLSSSRIGRLTYKLTRV